MHTPHLPQHTYHTTPHHTQTPHHTTGLRGTWPVLENTLGTLPYAVSQVVGAADNTLKFGLTRDTCLKLPLSNPPQDPVPLCNVPE